MPNLWNDEKNTFNRTKKPDGQLHIEGTVFLDDVTYKFYYNQQRNGRGRYIQEVRGEITVLSRIDGMKLQKNVVENENGKTIHPRDNVIRRQSIVRSTKTKDIQQKILSDIFDLRKKYYTEIETDFAKTPLDFLSPLRAVRMYGTQYLRNRQQKGKKAPSEITINSNFKKLEKLAAMLGSTMMANITYDKLQMTYEMLGKSAGKVFTMAHGFWEYCQNRGLYHGTNPFTAFYLLSGKIKHAPLDIRRLAMRPMALPNKVESRFVQRNNESPAPTAKELGLVLAYAGFSASAAVTLSVSAITQHTIAPGSMCVRVEKKDNAGATHDFTRPLAPFVSNMIRRYLDGHPHILKRKSAPLLQDDDEKLSAKNLTAYSRITLLELGMAERDMRADADAIYGVGIDLLHRNYKHWLQIDCGLKEDRGATNFLQGLSLPDTTSDHYRSLTCLDGQQFLRRALMRDKRYFPPPENKEISISTKIDSEITDISVPPSDPTRFTEVEIVLELYGDSWIELLSDVYIEGTIEVIELDEHTI